MRLFGLASVLLVAAPAAADPQFVTLERVDRGTRVGAQASVQLYPDFDDTFGLRGEFYAQHSVPTARGNAIGGYGHVSTALIVAPEHTAGALSSIALGGFYVARLSESADLTGSFGLSLPTASDDDDSQIANIMTHLERNHDLVNVLPDSFSLHVGLTARGGFGPSTFAQVDLAVDAPFASEADAEPFFHLNAGLGRWIGPAALLVEVATCWVADHRFGSLALGARFAMPSHPHVAYVMAFTNSEATTPGNDGGIVAHLLSLGVSFE